MRLKKTVASFFLTIALGGAIGVVSGAGTADAAACSIAAHVPTSAGKTIYSKGTSNCRGTIRTDVMWSIHGPDQSLASASTYGRSAVATKQCTWSVAKNRNIYTKAKRGSNQGVSRIKAYTSTKKGRC